MHGDIVKELRVNGGYQRISRKGTAIYTLYVSVQRARPAIMTRVYTRCVCDEYFMKKAVKNRQKT